MHSYLSTSYKNGVTMLTSDVTDGVNSLHRGGVVKNILKNVVVVSAAALALTLSGCGETVTDVSIAQYGPAEVDGENSDLSRVGLYPSLSSLARDSVLIATGTVTGQNVVADLDPTTEFTLSSFDISDVQSSSGSITTDSVVTVREIGSAGRDSSVTLEAGNTYLLYLTASGLEGELAAHYYVTGANVGIFEAEDEGSARADPRKRSSRRSTPR